MKQTKMTKTKNGFLWQPKGKNLKLPAQRIVSVIPSQTELLADFNLGERVIGITKFCVHPEEWFHEKERVGGPKKLNLDKIKALKPDLIIANKEENLKEEIEDLAESIPVYVSNVATVTDALNMIKDLGYLTGKEQEAETMVVEIRKKFNLLAEKKWPDIKTAYLIWKKPWMSVGNDTFIHKMMARAGFKNIFAAKSRYPEFTLEDLAKKQPEVILLSSEPYPFKQKHLEEFQGYFPNCRIILVDGELFCWYGSRMLQIPDYLNRLREELE